MLEKGVTGARCNAVAEEGGPLREIAEAIGRGLNIPVVAKSPRRQSGTLAGSPRFVGSDIPASSALTQRRLGWHPTQTPGLISDLDNMRYFPA